MPIRFSLSKRQSQILHYFVTGFGVAVAASLTGVASSGVFTVATLGHAVGAALITAVAGTIGQASGPQTPPSTPS